MSLAKPFLQRLAAVLAPRASWSFALLLACAFFMLPAANGQYDNGSALGTIRDASGAGISGATVRITNVATSITVETRTGDSGDYEVPTLRAGVYTITATAPGFSDTVAQNVTVSVGNRQRIDLTLKIGANNTTVEVSDVTLQVETQTSERGQTITNYQSEALPLVSRNYSDLLGLVAGSRQAPSAATTSSVNSLVRAGAYNINGQRSMFNNFLLDGLDNNSYGESNQGFDNQIIAVPPDSVSQFQVVTNNESAEYGRSSGATINVATLSGTNQFHATVYEFIRNTALNAAGFFKPTVNGPTGPVAFKKPTFNRNQFGMNLGGPILKNKVFFFLDYEGFRQTLKPLTVITVPTQNELNGILVVDVRNPVTGQVYPRGTAIPASAINPLSRQIISFFNQIPGLTQSGAAATGLAANNFAVQVPFTDKSDKGDLRFDWQQSPSTSWFLRGSERKENGVNYTALPIPLDSQSNGTTRVLNQQIAVGYTRLFGANKVFDARLGLSRTKAGKYSLSIGNNSITIPGLSGVPANLAGGLPTTSITGFSAFGRQSTNPQWQNPAIMDPKINFTYVKGRHSLKFGYEYVRLWQAVNDNNPQYGSFTYGGGYSACPFTTGAGGARVPTLAGCNSVAATVSDNYFADFLFGNTSGYSLANYFVAHLTQNLHSAYAQDDWKVSPKLTLNLGLRWEYGSPYADLYNNVSNFDPLTQTVLTTTPGAVTGNQITRVSEGGVYGKTLVDPDLNDFAPRVGFAFAPDAKTAIRGGFGMSFVHYTRAGSGNILPINAPQALFVAVNQGNLPPTTTNRCVGTPSFANVVGTPTVPGVPKCYVTADQGFPTGLATTFSSAIDNINYIPRNTRDSYVESYFLSVQRQLLKNTLLDVAYVGNHGLKLQGFANANQRNPALGFARPYANWTSDITAALNSFYSHYDSLQVKYEQRFVAGLTLLNSFTWSHALDNASASLEASTPSPQDINNIRADYGQSDYNLPVANVTSIVYELPIGRGRHFVSSANALIDGVIGGWQLSTINTMQAGTPFNLTYTPAAANQVSQQITASFRGANLYRPNVNPGINPIQNTQIAGTGYIQYVNPAAFTLPATRDSSSSLASPFGNAARNPLRNTAFYQTDLALNKKFATPVESLKVEFRTEFYNILNHTNLYLPGSVGGTIGQTATTGGQITSTFQPRVIQFGLKVLY